MGSKRRSLAGVLAGAVVVAAFPAVAAAGTINDGRPGRFEMSEMYIDAVDHDCKAVYATGVGSNDFVGGDDEAIHVVVNRNGAHATCRFTDTSGVFEDNAEVGYSDVCVLTTDGVVWSNGSGRVTVAANNAKDASDGGNAIISCHFDAEDAIVEESSETESEPAGDEGPGERPPRTERGKPPWAGGSKVDSPAKASKAVKASKAGKASKPAKAGKGPKADKLVKARKSGKGHPRR